MNKVETGVRAIHVPTGISVFCTEERSQYMNKQNSLKRLAPTLRKGDIVIMDPPACSGNSR